MDGTTTTTTSTIESTIQMPKDHIDNSHNKKLATNNIDSINESMTTINQISPTKYMNGDGECGGGSNSNRNEINVISKDEGGGCNTTIPTIEMNNKYQQITIDKSNANNIQLNNSNSDDDIGSNRQLDDKRETKCGDRNDDINSGREQSFDSGEYIGFWKQKKFVRICHNENTTLCQIRHNR